MGKICSSAFRSISSNFNEYLLIYSNMSRSVSNKVQNASMQKLVDAYYAYFVFARKACIALIFFCFISIFQLRCNCMICQRSSFSVCQVIENSNSGNFFEYQLHESIFSGTWVCVCVQNEQWSNFIKVSALHVNSDFKQRVQL